MTAFHVGQTLLWLAPDRRNAEPKEVTVTKVGRTLVHITRGYGRDEGYRMDTGYGSKDFMGRVVTPEQYAEEEERKLVMATLRKDFGLTVAGAFSRDIPASAWAQVLAILQGARP